MRTNILKYSLLSAVLCSINLWGGNYVIINQVMYDSPANEIVVYPPYSNGEFIELYNGGAESVSLQGWYMTGESLTERFDFPNISIPTKGFLQVAFRHEDSPLFMLDSIYSSPLVIQSDHVIYQHNVVLANYGETITLYNAAQEVVDQLYYDGTSNLSQPNRLCANNEDNLSGNQCVSLHRTWVEFDEEGRVVSGTSQWKTDIVSFDTCQLAESSFYEHYLVGSSLSHSGVNYILAVSPLDPTTRVSVSDNGISVSNGVRTQTTIQYYDGLGRPVETTVIGAAPDHRDLVAVTDYNGLHFAVKQWLPISTNTEGEYIDVSDLKTLAQTYYSDNRPFAETLYEYSALERVVGHKQSGNAWENHPSSNTYAINDASDNVRIYSVVNDSVLKATGENYNAGTLYKTIVTDEDGKSVTTFTDKLGRKIMEERAGNRTYYVYDQLNRLRYVLPHISPTKLANGEYAPSDSTLRAAAYYYKYDGRGNVICKRLPGREPQYMVYDQAKQLILSQDGNQRPQNKWILYTYDSIGRNLYTAELLSMTSHDEHLLYFADRWYVEHYGNNPSHTSLPGTGYASSIFHKSFLRLLTVNYYDDYHYLTRIATPVRQKLRFEQESGYGLQYDNATGMLTGTRIYSLAEKDDYTVTSYYYDTKGRIVQNRSVRIGDGYRTATSTEYLFDGSIAQQLSLQGTDSSLVREHYRYTYDHVGRIKQTYYKLNNEEEILLSDYSYDRLGRLAQNLLHNKKDEIRYFYDMRNMLTEIYNKHYTEILLYEASGFLEDYAPHAQACYNGNIAAARITQMDTTFTFDYTYDALNRLTESVQEVGNHTVPSEWFQYDPRGNITALQRYSGPRLMDDLIFTYQEDGNQLLSIKDDGLDVDRYEVIEYSDLHHEVDSIDMRYDANGNLIFDADRGISVIHYNILNLPDTIQFINGNQIVNLYDAVGQKYKSIVYTNLSTTMTPYYSIVHYPLDADTIWYNITEYAGNIENHYSRIDTTQCIFNSIGYYTDSVYYHYIKDHLGNICAVVNSAADTLVQSTIYYPSGVPMAQNLGPNVTPSYYNVLGIQYTKNFGRDEQPYLYNGKEFIEAHGLNEYNSQARYYYSPIMRTTTIDPHAENRYYLSPYVWCGNNPINRIDLNGMDDVFDKNGNHRYHIDNETDRVLVETANGDIQNLTDFSYGENDVANRAMLANVATYFAHQIGLNQTLDVCDIEREGGMAVTDIQSDFHQVFMTVIDGKINENANTANNIMSALVHEDDHVRKGTRGHIAEVEAIVKEINHPTWALTTDKYKQATMQYLVDNANAAKNSVYSTIEPIMNILETFGIILNYNQGSNKYSWYTLCPEVVVVAPLKQ